MEQRKKASEKNGLSDISDSENPGIFDNSSSSDEDFYSENDEESDEDSD